MFKQTTDVPATEALIEQVAHALSRNGYLHFLNLETKQVQTLNEKMWGIEDAMYDIEEKPDTYLQIIPLLDNGRQLLRRRFALKLADTDIKNELLMAINSYNATTNWQKTLSKYDDIQAQWYYFRDKYFVELAQKWLYENGLLSQ